MSKTKTPKARRVVARLDRHGAWITEKTKGKQ